MKPVPCVVCGRPSTCTLRGHRLCFGNPKAPRCGARLWALLPQPNEPEFINGWIAAERQKVAALGNHPAQRRTA